MTFERRYQEMIKHDGVEVEYKLSNEVHFFMASNYHVENCLVKMIVGTSYWMHSIYSRINAYETFHNCDAPRRHRQRTA